MKYRNVRLMGGPADGLEMQIPEGAARVVPKEFPTAVYVRQIIHGHPLLFCEDCNVEDPDAYEQYLYERPL